ncbi:hypothetical protein [uncultured Nocardioides sp.]|jgi:hypothetical protein|uniref:hypothetical protein n=1 Tax=uncultured Nocardioides sp. TaxID=198441 RepID=UPI002638F650|nr:hypothetical protein [uncultured Nocardioides sp.]
MAQRDRSWVEDPGSVDDWRQVKRRLLRWRLVRISAGLLPLCLVTTVLYAWLAATSGQELFWIGPALGLPALATAVVGVRRGFRMIDSPEPAQTGPYWVLLLSGVLALLGLVLPGYLYA